jgi:hypothetical protein
MAISFNGSIPTPNILGNDATGQNLFALTNKIGSRVNVLIRRAAVQVDPIAGLTSVMPIVRASRATGVSGGAIVRGTTYDSSNSSSSYVEVRTPILDGFPLTATAGDTMWQQYTSRLHTAVEQVLAEDKNILPYLVESHDLIVRPGESILFKVVGASSASNARLTNNWFVTCEWEEDALSTFNISGTVTLGGSPVSGAIVTIIEADDTSMTNQIIVEKITTGAGGAWASTIKTGKVGAAFVQYESGGTYYTAPGSPYLE